jgi:hypothetical protein
MKKITKVLMLFAAVMLFSITNSDAQIVVKARLFHRGAVVIRPARPSAAHVWVGAEWTPSGSTYVEHPGYWAMPPHPGAVWIAGHWANRPRGYVWIPGHWR